MVAYFDNYVETNDVATNNLTNIWINSLATNANTNSFYTIIKSDIS